MNATTQTETKRFTDATGYKRHPQPIKAALAIVSKAQRLGASFVQLEGITGVNERRSVVSVLGGLFGDGDRPSHKADEAFNEIGERYGWKITRDNVAALAKDCMTLINRAKAEGSSLLAIKDNRRTPEEDNARMEKIRREQEERDAQRAAEDAEKAKQAAEAEKQLGSDPSKRLPNDIAYGDVDGCEGIKVPLFDCDRYSSKGASTVYPYGVFQDVGDGHGDVCKLIRQRIKEAQQAGILMPCKVSVRKEWATHSASISISIAAVPGTVENPEYIAFKKEHGDRWYDQPRHTIPGQYRPEITSALHVIESIARMYHWDKSDSQSDYFHSRFYLSVDVHYKVEESWAPPARMLKRTPACAAKGSSPAVATNDGETFAIERHEHSKKQRTMVVVVSTGTRSDKETWKGRTDEASQRGGWYGRAYRATDFPGGWCWWEDDNGQEAAESFLAWLTGTSTPPSDDPDGIPTEEGQDGLTAAQTKTVERLQGMADKMAEQAQAKLAPRDTNTPKRIAQAAHARIDGMRLERGAALLTGIAAAMQNGQWDWGQKTPTKAVVLAAVAKKLGEPVLNGYHYYMETDEWTDTSNETQALRQLMECDQSATQQDVELERLVASVRMSKIPGFFPTPGPVIADMIAAAGDMDGARVLEPSAGLGDLADAARDAGAEVVDCYEIDYTLIKILDHKGHFVTCSDFLDESEGATELYDVVLMNPPFEKGADAEHVQAAYKWLKSGGRLVAIMSAGTFQRNDVKAASFRGWLSSLSSEVLDNDPDAFKKAFNSTGVHTKLVVIDK